MLFSFCHPQVNTNFADVLLLFKVLYIMLINLYIKSIISFSTKKHQNQKLSLILLFLKTVFFSRFLQVIVDLKGSECTWSYQTPPSSPSTTVSRKSSMCRCVWQQSPALNIVLKPENQEGFNKNINQSQTKPFVSLSLASLFTASEDHLDQFGNICKF